MPTIRLTEKSIARLPAPDPSGRQALHWSDELKGFGVLCSGTTGAKSYIVQHALADGTRRRVTIARTNVITLDAAVVEAKKVLATFYSGRDPKSLGRENPTLRSALADMLAGRPDLKSRSKAFYEDAINRHLEPWLDTPLRSITRQSVEERLAKIAGNVSATSKYSGNATANGVMRSFRAVYNFAADRAPADNPLPPNPVRLKKVWLPVMSRTRMVPSADVKKFYDAVCALESKVASDYLRLVMFTGLRRREASGLLWTHMDFDQRVINLPASMTKATRALPLPMSDFVFNLLSARRGLGDTKWVFPANSKSGHLEEPKSFLKEVATACGVKVSVHDLRRGFITIAESLDLSPYALKGLVNHALGDKDVTEGYIQMDAERLRAPMQKVTDRLKQLCGLI